METVEACEGGTGRGQGAEQSGEPEKAVAGALRHTSSLDAGAGGAAAAAGPTLGIDPADVNRGWVLLQKPVTLELELAEGTWQLDAWIPESGQGVVKKNRFAGKLTGNWVRCLKLEVSYGDTVDKSNLRTVKDRASHTVTVEAAQAPLQVTVRFSTLAVVVPVHFRFHFARKDGPQPGGLAARSSSSNGSLSSVPQSGPLQSGTVEWLEQRYHKLPFEDKVVVARRAREAEAEGWPDLDGASAVSFDNSLGVASMARESPFKLKAFELGLIRPFLLLVSMHPLRRFAWAITLDINLARGENFGDAHWEALEVLTHARKGVLSRAERTFREQLNPFSHGLDWFALLHRVLSGIADPEERKKLKETKLPKGESKQLSSDPALAAGPAHLENAFAAKFYRLQGDHFFDNKGVLIAPEGEDVGDAEAEIAGEEEIIAEGDAAGNEDEDEDEDEEAVAAGGGVTRDVLRQVAVQSVAEDPEMAALAERLRRHGDTDDAAIALAVLNAFRKDALPVSMTDISAGDGVSQEEADVAEAMKNDWDQRWGTQVEMFNAEFCEEVEKRCNFKSRKRLIRTGVCTVLPLIIASVSGGPAAVTVLMVGRTAFKAAFPNAPETVIALVCGLVMQRHWLAIADIGIEAFYPSPRA